MALGPFANFTNPINSCQLHCKAECAGTRSHYLVGSHAHDTQIYTYSGGREEDFINIFCKTPHLLGSK